MWICLCAWGRSTRQDPSVRTLGGWLGHRFLAVAEITITDYYFFLYKASLIVAICSISALVIAFSVRSHLDVGVFFLSLSRSFHHAVFAKKKCLVRVSLKRSHRIFSNTVTLLLDVLEFCTSWCPASASRLFSRFCFAFVFPFPNLSVFFFYFSNHLRKEEFINGEKREKARGFVFKC